MRNAKSVTKWINSCAKIYQTGLTFGTFEPAQSKADKWFLRHATKSRLSNIAATPTKIQCGNSGRNRRRPTGFSIVHEPRISRMGADDLGAVSKVS